MNYKRIKSLVLSIMLIPFVANTDYCIDSCVLILFNVFIAIQANFKTNTRTNKSCIFESTYNKLFRCDCILKCIKTLYKSSKIVLIDF